MIQKTSIAAAYATIIVLGGLAGQSLQDVRRPEQTKADLHHLWDWIIRQAPSEKSWNLFTLAVMALPLGVIIGLTIWRTFRWDRVSIALTLFAGFLFVLFILGILSTIWLTLIPIETKWAIRIVGGFVGLFASWAMVRDPRRTVAPSYDGRDRRIGERRRPVEED